MRIELKNINQLFPLLNSLSQSPGRHRRGWRMGTPMETSGASSATTKPFRLPILPPTLFWAWTVAPPPPSASASLSNTSTSTLTPILLPSSPAPSPVAPTTTALEVLLFPLPLTPTFALLHLISSTIECELWWTINRKWKIVKFWRKSCGSSVEEMEDGRVKKGFINFGTLWLYYQLCMKDLTSLCSCPPLASDKWNKNGLNGKRTLLVRVLSVVFFGTI